MSIQALRCSPTVEFPKISEDARPLDLIHLAHQTLGDRGLEIELLSLFERQAGQIMAQIEAFAGSADRRLRHDLAHTLKGSARAVGAPRVAASAQTYEDVLYSGAAEVKVAVACETLAQAVAEAREAVQALLADR